MKIEFTKEELENKINVIEVEDVILEGNYIEINENNDEYLICGRALIDGEHYKDFEILFTLTQKPKDNSCKEILDIEWDEYDFVF